MEEIAYKAICIDHEKNTIRVIDETLDIESAQMSLYMDECDEPAPDKKLCFTWEILRTYKFNTKI